ncbi:MAG TPA: hypothetical protein VMH28_32670 [Candidatus Acidoferrales bacterium]|nr:hypothetical protein [Candidatus Acidoferrales bacterium]
MPAEPCPPDPPSRQALVRFLLSAFQLPPESPFVRPDLLQWKYDQPRPDFSGPRSYVWKGGSGEITAHACLCPVTYCLPGGEIRGSYLIDWAASRSSPGAGVSLLRTLAKGFDVLLAVGGSPETVAILPKLGYRRVSDLQFFARVVQPWRQFRSDPFPRGWKAPARLVRNTLRSRAGLPPIPPDWSAHPVASFDMSCQPLLEARVHSPFPSTRRTPGLMNYLIACPAALYSAALVRQKGELRGWYVVSRAGGQSRIADLWLDSNLVSDWAAAYSLALRAAAGDPATCEVVAAASIPLAIEAAAAAGLRPHHTEPVFALDPKLLLSSAPAINATFLESDLAYHLNPAYPYLT